MIFLRKIDTISFTPRTIPHIIPMATLLNVPYNNSAFDSIFAEFPFPLRDFQKHTTEGIHTDKNILVIASTGNGKTVCCESAFKFHLANGKKVIYTSPIKALSNQKFHDFSKLFPNQCGISTGDITFNCVDAKIIIMTTEILRMLLFNPNSEGELSTFDFADVGCIIFDEAHYINNVQRGKFWEESIILSPPHIQLLFLSATLNQPTVFANWIATVKPERHVIIPFTLNRVVPLKHYVFSIIPPHYIKNIKDATEKQKINENNGKPVLLKDDANKFYQTSYNTMSMHKNFINKNNIVIKPTFVLNSIAKYTKENNLLPAICFIFSRRNIEKWVTEMELNLFEDDNKTQYTIKEECKNILMKFPNYREYINLPEFETITNLLQKGISYHHAGLLAVFREMIEILFDKGYIKMLFATETFSIGLNLKIKTVIFTGMQKFDGSTKRILHPHEYAQASGRAGRQGYDDVGHVIHLNNMFDLPTSVEYNNVLNGLPQTISSKFKITYNLALNALSIPSCATVIKKSMLNDVIDGSVRELEKENAEITKQLDAINVTMPQNINENAIAEIANLKKQFTTANGNQRRKIAKQLESLEKDVPANYATDFEKRQILSNKLAKNIAEIANTKNSLDVAMEKIMNILRKNGFVGENENATKTGILATNVMEMHPLAIIDLLESTNNLASHSPQEIIGLFSCFATPTIDEDYIILAETLDETIPINKTIKNMQNLYNKYVDEEAKNNITTDAEYDLQFNLIEPVMQWAKTENELECKQIIRELDGIFLGEFVRALLKINNISLELGRIVDDVEFKYKMSLIPDMVLKFVATNQSLYV